ncbi:MAG TPA: AAA family ATPase [Burkholderiales bacterium]|nr:AAA family ATPase [Burkholderiales bacterium]
MTKRPRLIGLTGTNGAGKGETAAFFKARGYAYLSLSDILRDELRARGLEITRDNLIRTGNELRRRFGPDILARRTMEKVSGPTVIDSIRNVREVEYFRTQKGFVLLALDAPAEVRFARVAARGRDESAGTLEEFRKKEEEERAGGEAAQQLEACMALADHRILNAGTLDDLHRELERLL